MFGRDLAVAQGMCLFAGQLQGPAWRKTAGRTAASTPPVRPATSAGGSPARSLPHRVKAEGLLGLVPDDVQVDAERP